MSTMIETQLRNLRFIIIGSSYWLLVRLTAAVVNYRVSESALTGIRRSVSSSKSAVAGRPSVVR